MRILMRSIQLGLLLSISPFWQVGQVYAQTPTPTVNTSQPPGWWQMTQDSIPYVVLLGIALLAFILGTVARPLLGHLGNGLLNWFKGLGSEGAFRRRYLTAIVSECRHVALPPANVIAARWEFRRKAAELEDLYVPLAFGPVDQEVGEERAGVMKQGLSRSRRLPDWVQRLWRRLRPPHKPSAGDLGKTLSVHRRLIVRGDPGSGKTTILRYLALTCARSLRNDKADGDRRTFAWRRLGWKRPLFPLLVPLNRLADVMNWPENRTLVEEIAGTLPGELRKYEATTLFERQLRRGHNLVLFDGFDELGSPEARGRMAALIADMIDTYGLKSNCFVVSTRIVGYEGQLDKYGFVIRTIQDLDDAAVRQLVELRYRTAAVSEGLGLSQQEQKDLRTHYSAQAEKLLVDLRRNTSLRALTTNPLLLSLITLVHMVKVSLPEERHLLYRDCVEILTERWRESQRTDVGIRSERQVDELKLDHKIVVLRELALQMQQQRKGEERQVVIARSQVEQIIAQRLPDFLAAHLPENEVARDQECRRRAELLLDNIRLESGILVEMGPGHGNIVEPVIGFAHLTFQEYLAADAVREQPARLALLTENLFDAAWRQVLLLYVAMGDAGGIVRACLTQPKYLDFVKLLLAGRCLAEKVSIEPALRRQVLDGLGRHLLPAVQPEQVEIEQLLALVGGEANYDWMLESLPALLSAEEQATITKMAQATEQERPYALLQQILLRLALTHPTVTIRPIAGSILSGLGDPRDLTEMVPVAAGEFVMGGNMFDDEKPQHQVKLEAFRISKYPVTTRQYADFVAAAGHTAPPHWRGDRPPAELLTHPVIGVSWHDAMAYCAWLSRERGELVRLPTEAEWEKAARGTDGREYPWGDKFDAQLCNMNKTGIGGTSPVGIFPQGASPYGCLDMAGNVWEWTLSQFQKYPYDQTDGRELLTDDTARVVRGGSWVNLEVNVRCARRLRVNPTNLSNVIGFRVVAPGL